MKQNFSECELYPDIKSFNAKQYENQITILTGGFPCQPFSVAGKQRSTSDDRFLWPEMLRVIREIKPPFIIGENVPGIINLALDQVLSDLEAETYTVETFSIPACSLNATHRRDRVWIIAYSESWWRRRYGNSDQTKRDCSSKETQFIISPSIITNANSIGRKIQASGKQSTKQMSGSNGSERPDTDTHSASTEHQISTGRNMPPSNVWEQWTAESPICGMDDGIPHRVHRIKALGNAIVPQIAYEIFNIIEKLMLIK